jgi:hypothetical protein
MNTLEVQAGDVVVTTFGMDPHWSLVSDKFCSLGKNMLISATKRTGTVREEPWDDVTQSVLKQVLRPLLITLSGNLFGARKAPMAVVPRVI